MEPSNLTDSVDMNLSKLGERVKNRGAWCVAVYGVAKSWAQRSNNNNSNNNFNRDCYLQKGGFATRTLSHQALSRFFVTWL